VLLIAAMRRNDEREECKMTALFGAAAAASATCAAGRLSRTGCERPRNLCIHLVENDVIFLVYLTTVCQLHKLRNVE
jgi:hypothetical protein